ncbi:hypothetical protein Ahia01_001244200 [Argonauta hians]
MCNVPVNIEDADSSPNVSYKSFDDDDAQMNMLLMIDPDRFARGNMSYVHWFKTSITKPDLERGVVANSGDQIQYQPPIFHRKTHRYQFLLYYQTHVPVIALPKVKKNRVINVQQFEKLNEVRPVYAYQYVIGSMTTDLALLDKSRGTATRPLNNTILLLFCLTFTFLVVMGWTGRLDQTGQVHPKK